MQWVEPAWLQQSIAGGGEPRPGGQRQMDAALVRRGYTAPAENRREQRVDFRPSRDCSIRRGAWIILAVVRASWSIDLQPPTESPGKESLETIGPLCAQGLPTAAQAGNLLWHRSGHPTT
ncbi:hypothetical protein GCM10028796_25940 [Ramlibacter monticola]